MITFNSNPNCDGFIKVKIQMVTLGTVSMVNRKEISDKEKKKNNLNIYLESRNMRLYYQVFLW